MYSVIECGQRPRARGAGLVVTPDSGGHGEDALGDTDGDALEGPFAVLLQVQLPRRSPQKKRVQKSVSVASSRIAFLTVVRGVDRGSATMAVEPLSVSVEDPLYERVEVAAHRTYPSRVRSRSSGRPTMRERPGGLGRPYGHADEGERPGAR